MNPPVQYGFEARGSYAPRLVVRIPAALTRTDQCSVYVLAPLPPGVYFDPYTARVEHTEPVRAAQALGPVELEKPVGWAADGAFEDEVQRTWWERGDDHNIALAEKASRLGTLCHGAVCEHTAVLLELAPRSEDMRATQVHVPLHVRYYPARAPTAPPAAPAPGASVWERLVSPIFTRWSAQQYDDVPLTLDGPVVFAACDAAPDALLWEPAEPADLLHGHHAHLRGELAALLAPGARALFTSSVRAVADTEVTAAVPVGNVTLYPAVLLLTLVAVLWSTRAVVHSVRRAVAAA